MILDELKFWVNQTIIYRQEFQKNNEDKAEIRALEMVVEKIKELENIANNKYWE